jgi:hypothetical protein
VHGRHPTGETARRLIDTRAPAACADFGRACTVRDDPRKSAPADLRVRCRRRNEPEAFLYAFDLLELAPVGLANAAVATVNTSPFKGLVLENPAPRHLVGDSR